MKLLRQIVRRIILEVYELDDKQKYRKQELESAGSWGSKLAKGAGLQSKADQIADRDALRIYQQELHSDKIQGNKLVKAFQEGKVTILHSFVYEGATSSCGQGGTSMESLASSWIKKYGRRGKDALSVVAFYEPPTSSVGTKKRIIGNPKYVLDDMGVILKGYPVFVGDEDLMTQTLGAVDDKMKAHWKQSGIPKRPTTEKGDHGGFKGMIRLGRLKKLGYSDETILDNWTVIGTFINTQGRSADTIERFVVDSLELGLPCNVYGANGKLLERRQP